MRDVSYSSLLVMVEPLTPVTQTGDSHFPLSKGPYQAALIQKLVGNSAAQAWI